MGDKKIDDGGPAFPELWQEWNDGSQEYDWHNAYGMTLRDYFAAKAMMVAGILVQPKPADPDPKARDIAKAAYEIADEMLKARK